MEASANSGIVMWICCPTEFIKLIVMSVTFPYKPLGRSDVVITSKR